jgi:Phenazine biosynthesis-like protein
MYTQREFNKRCLHTACPRMLWLPCKSTVETIMNSSNEYRYLVVDIFTQNPLEGNPLAVFPNALDMDDGLMQRIARELNLAGNGFCVPGNSAELRCGCEDLRQRKR